MRTINRINHVLAAAFALIIICVVASAAHAQLGADDGVRVEADLSRQSVYVGDEVSYSITVYGADNPEPPEIEFPGLVRAVFHGRSSQSFTSMQVDSSGRQRTVTRRSFVFQYTLTATREGIVEIPAPSVEDGGKTYRGPVTSFRALLPSESTEDLLELRFERTHLFQNETIEGECVWWIGDSTSEFNFSSSSIPDSFEIRPVPVPGGSQYTLDFPLAGQTLTGRVDTAIRDGRERSRFTFRFTITPTRTGTIELGPMQAIFTRQSGTGSRYRAYVDSNTVAFEVMPVPSAGKPDLYEGAIGSFSLASRASNTRVNVGDPISLTLRIEGQEPMTGVQNAPDLTRDPEFSEQFKVDSDGWREVMPRRNGVRTYETTVRALSDSVQEIPAIKVPSFDPVAGRYETFASDPIPLSVTAVKEVTLADALVTTPREGPTTPTRPSIDHIELTPAAPGLWAHGSADQMRSDPGFNLAKTLQDPKWIVTLAAPPVVYLALLSVIGYRRSRNPELVRIMRTYRAARAQSGIASLRTYVSGVLNISPEAITASDAMQLPIEDRLRRMAYEQMLIAETRSALPTSVSQDPALLRSIHEQCLGACKEARS